MKELKTKEEVESALCLSERFYILFFKRNSEDESLIVFNMLETIEKERDDPYLFYFFIDTEKSSEVRDHLDTITKMNPQASHCFAFFSFKPMFWLSQKEMTREKLESLIPILQP